mmetsp:Transcript_28305/g.50955  ORF Transcript_28305/g.50955 Transcript_28305/m.50955 type:complete len:265 (-) Transcript_28305:571-1365(-)
MMPRPRVTLSPVLTSLVLTPSTPAWRPPRSTVVPSWSPSPRVVVSSSLVRAPITRTTLPPSLVLLPVLCTSVPLPSCTVSPSSSTLTTARRLGCPGSMDCWMPTRSTSRSTVSPCSLRTCLISLRNPSRRTLPSARSTWSAWPRSICCSSSSWVSLVVRRMVLTTVMSTPAACTPSPRRSGMPTSSCPRSPTPRSPALLPSVTCTACTPLETLTCSPSSCTTPRSTSRRSSALMMTSPCVSSSTVVLDPPLRTSSTPLVPVSSR